MSLVSEPIARKISPIFFVLAGLCFLLPFAGVSCNTSTAKSALAPLLGSVPGAGGNQTAAFNSCLDALNNFNFVTYSGANLAFNTTPSTRSNSDLPNECQSLGGGSSSTPSASSANPFSDSEQAKLGVQPFALAALVLIIAGLVLSIFKLPMRGLLTAAAGLVAIVLLLLQNSRSKDLLSQKITESINAQGGGGSSSLLPSGIDFASLFQVNLAYGAIVCMVLLAVAALYNLASQFLGGSPSLAPAGGYSPSAPMPPPADPGAPPPG